MSRYRIQGQPHYRNKRLYRVGDVVEIPDGEQPAPDWELLQDEPPAAEPKDEAPKGKPSKGKRPSDADVL